MLGALETVGGEELTVTYIRHLWSSMHGPTRERELFSEIKGTIKSKQAAIGLANDLGENANLYAAILNPSHSFWNDFAPSTRKHIATLQQLQMQQVRPLLLAVATLPKVEVARALRLLVNYSVRFLIVGGLGGGALEDQYARLAIKIRSNKITTAKTLAQELGKVVPLDVAFRSSFETATVSKSYLARYYLRALQLRADGNAEPEYVPADDESINLEHILPQSLSSVWSHIDHETAQAFYRRLGNMVLLKADVNAVIGNDAFTKKKQVYKKSEYSLTAEVANSSQWGTTEINDRQKKLAALALKTWPLSV